MHTRYIYDNYILHCGIYVLHWMFIRKIKEIIIKMILV